MIKPISNSRRTQCGHYHGHPRQIADNISATISANDERFDIIEDKLAHNLAPDELPVLLLTHPPLRLRHRQLGRVHHRPVDGRERLGGVQISRGVNQPNPRQVHQRTTDAYGICCCVGNAH